MSCQPMCPNSCGKSCCKSKCGPKICSVVKVKCGCMSATLAITASTGTYSTLGQVITYTYTISNTGTVPINNQIQINDSRLGTRYLPCTYIGCGMTGNFPRTYNITSADLAATSLTNNATAFIHAKRCKYVCTNQATVTINNGSVFLTAPGTSLLSSLSASPEEKKDIKLSLTREKIADGWQILILAANLGKESITFPSISLDYTEEVKDVFSVYNCIIGNNSIVVKAAFLEPGSILTGIFKYKCDSEFPWKADFNANTVKKITETTIKN